MTSNKILIILGNQLFPIKEIEKTGCNTIFMKEDLGLATNHLHHKLKLLMFFSAMREYRDHLVDNGYDVLYHSISDSSFSKSFISVFDQTVLDNKIDTVNFFEIVDKPFSETFFSYTQKSNVKFIQHSSPMFIFKKENFLELINQNRTIRMGSFYKSARIKLNILIDNDKNPIGGKWSFDEDNRKKLPKAISLPEIPRAKKSKYSEDLSSQIEKLFKDHPGCLSNLWMPTNREDSKIWLSNFFKYKFKDFGAYEDAIDSNNNFVFHSALSSILNLGLLTPKEVVDETLNFAQKNSVPINSLEGFIRQIIGWREFIRIVYEINGQEQINSNFFNHNRRLSHHWYDGTTGIDPLDDAIKDCINFGFTHHIPRLMIIANIMNLARIHPQEIYKWFMEMFVDSSDWVMVPNIFGMGTFADGGIFATKPYSCGSNYILKMSNYKKAEWCDIVDGLYWKFMSDNKEFFKKNHRLSILTKALERMTQERKDMLFLKSDKFIAEKTL